MASSMHIKKCIICNAPESSEDKLRNPSSGLQTIADFGKLFRRVDIQSCVASVDLKDINIHSKCQKKISNELRKKRRNKNEISGSSNSKMQRRSDDICPFDWKFHCLICGKAADDDEKARHPDRQASNLSYPESHNLKTRLLEICSRSNKANSDQVHTVRGRLMAVDDVVAAKTRYHRSCFRDFSRDKIIDDEAPEKRKGRPVNEQQSENFAQLCDWLELEADFHSVADLHKKMKEIAGDTGPIYADARYLKQQLMKKYGNSIFFAEVDGKSDVVCFTNIANFLINDVWCNKSKFTEDPIEDYQAESNRIIVTAAKLILNELRSQKYDCSVYPSNEIIVDVEKNKDWLAPGLRLFMESMIRNPLKQASIGQAITHAIKPNSSVPPILFGTGVEMDHMFGSKWQLTELSSLGFSVSSKEVTRYKQSVVCNEDINKYIKQALQGQFGQWSADNVDIRVSDLDGKSSLHAMGVVLSTTSGMDSRSSNQSVIPRQRVKKVADLAVNKGIPIISYIAEVNGLSKAVLKKRASLENYHIFKKESKDLCVDLLWHTTHFVPKLEENHPGWTGFMTNVSKGSYPGKSEINMLPIIDLDPTDMSCIYSTICFVVSQAKELNIPTPVITFDQPLWVKANEIALSLDLHVVLILGGFHTLMSFAGSIGSVMAGSGLSEAFTSVYGVDVVKHIGSGKAIARSLRANFMVETVLIRRLMSTFFPNNDESFTSDDSELADMEVEEELNYEDYSDDAEIREMVEDENTSYPNLEVLSEQDVYEIENNCNRIHENYESGLRHLQRSEALMKVERNMISLKSHLSKSSRTAKLWIQYLEYVNIMKMFIRAERTGNWSLHLQTLNKMLNLFAASGHYHYAKAGRLYLQQMCELETKFPWVYDKFANLGFHTVRRSDRFWAGLWSDLIIEQVMMRSLKSRGGLTGGRGTTESVRLTWIHSMHRCASVHDAMGTLTGHHSRSNEHIELGETRIKRDILDMGKISKWFDTRNPFDPRFSNLRSLSSGLCATDDNDINCDNAEKIGSIIQEKMDGIPFPNITLSRKDHARTLDLLQVGVVIDKKVVHIDPLLLFTRATTLVERLDLKSQIDCFAHEFTPEPTSLFKDGLMRKPKKEELRNRLLDYDLCSVKPITNFCVIDGGAALHKAPWIMNATFAELAERFKSDMLSRYSDFGQVHIVFDGYDDELSTKTDEQEDRSRSGKIASNVIIPEDGNIPVLAQKAEFLRNNHNKKQLISFLRAQLEDAGIQSSQARGDADTLIVATALAAAEDGIRTVVVSDDTDILVLLHYHHSPSMADVFFQTSRKLPVIPVEGATDAQIKKATAKSKQKPIPMWWNVALLNSSDIPPHLLLFVHAWCGCDTTSAIYGKGKTRIISILKDRQLKCAAEIFCRKNASKEEIVDAGTKIMIAMYNGKKDDTPASLRQASWSKIVQQKKKLHPDCLCPTDRAISFHSERVYLQVQKWDTLNDQCLDPYKWGFYKKVNSLKPIKTDLEPAPESILNIVRCNCKLSSKNTCGTMVCSCRKHGLPCVRACGDCRGMSCNNLSLAYRSQDDEELE